MLAKGQHPRRMQAWFGQRWQAVRGASRQQLVYFGALFAVVSLGTFLRLNGYLFHQVSLWLDEALWAPRFVELPILKLGIRPIGFVWLTRLLVHNFGATEIWLRFLPNLAALLSLWAMPYVASRLLGSKPLRVLLVLLFAIHPALVDFANEFKPYSFEVLIHLVPLLLYLRHQQTGKDTYLYALLAYLPVSFLLAYNMAFAFPGVLLTCLSIARSSAEKKRLLVATLLSGALCLAAVGVVYKVALSRVTKEDKTESYWGKKYDVFYRGNDDESRLDWTLGKYRDLSAFVGMRRQLWSDPGKLPEKIALEVGAVDRWAWTLLSLAGLLALWRTRRRELLLLVAPLVVLTLANMVGKWPLGAFRTNLFTSVYLFPLPILGLELLLAHLRRVGQATAGLLLLTTVGLGFTCGFDWHGHKRTWTRDHYQREVIERLYALRTKQLAKEPDLPRARLILDLHTYESHEYYLKTHPEFRAKYHDFFAKNFIQDNVGSNSLVSRAQQRLRRRDPVWVVASKDISSKAIEDFAKGQVRVLARENVGDQHLILLLDKD
jgi:hypothetical protein